MINTKTVAIALAAALIAALAVAGAWCYENQSRGTRRLQCALVELQMIIALMKDNQALRQELQSEPYIEKNSGVLQSYLDQIRRDGVAKHADMKQRLDQLAENNTAIDTLVKAYSPQAKTAAFTAEGDKFRNYAAAWRDRWNSLMEIFMAGGNYPIAETQFPREFATAVIAESTAVR